MAENKQCTSPASGTGSGFRVDPRFVNLRAIGHGGNGVVYSATDSDRDKEVAIKKLSFSDKRSCKYVLRELRIMRRLQHENIVTVYEILGSNGYSLERGGAVQSNPAGNCNVYIVQELLHADLHHLNQSGQLTGEHVRLFMYQLLRGLKYIHSANVLHRDLKPMNLLVNVEDLVLKIADFGLARVMDTDYCHKGFLTDSVGTCWYRSPELIITPRDYTKGIDMWSVGCILAELLTGKVLFPGAHEMDQIGQILDCCYLSDNEWNTVTQILPHNFVCKYNRSPRKPLKDRFTNIDIDALDLLEKLLVFEAGLRVTAEDALAHPYLQPFSCLEDEPIVLQPFHVEHEVDELSPKSARRAISNEMPKTVESCGTRNVSRSDHSQSPVEIPDRHVLLSDEVDNENLVAETNEHIDTCDENLKHSSETQHIDPSPSITDFHPVDDDTTHRNNADNSCPRIEDFISDVTDKNSRNICQKNITCEDENYDDSSTRNIVKAFPRSNVRDTNWYECDSDIRRINDLLAFDDEPVPTLENEIKNLQIIVDLQPEEENHKEQISPKENRQNSDDIPAETKPTKDIDNEHNEHLAEHLVVQIEGIHETTQNPVLQKAKDILNAERRAESPRIDIDQKGDRIDFIKVEKERLNTGNERFKNTNTRKEKRKKKNRRNNRDNSTEGQDFDALYRLPTEHLTRHRNSICGKDRSLKKVEEQLKLNEELNERKKLAELDKEKCVGAVGGLQYELDELTGRRSRASTAGNISPVSEHSRDSSPSIDEQNAPRRFEH